MASSWNGGCIVCGSDKFGVGVKSGTLRTGRSPKGHMPCKEQKDMNCMYDKYTAVYHLDINPRFQEMNLQSTYFRSNSTSDEADEQQLSLINERKQRRMISNRESARRSRMRKQKHLDELWSQVIWLRNENHQLVNKLNKFSGTHDQVLQENAQLKEEASELREMVNKLQLNAPIILL
ncbi:hypothetical protein L6452_02777 [Arctium lappa]|uniref:Uncharacterized protein n=1 Tax=Arctium lappa TaxID=4217 RepID=A0ACB9FLM0_ARCLA|nr:hypothetical protein L6452_02777 [Arctium lappa]